MTRIACFAPSRLTLGTVQLGMAYGVANAAGMPDEAEARAILDAALAAGIDTLDTASAYGASEQRIGAWLQARAAGRVRVITKVPAVPPAARRAPHAFVAETLRTSTARLGRRPLDLVLAHRGEDLLESPLAECLQRAIAAGELRAFGASVYSPDMALRLLERVPLAALQVPVSVADRRFAEAGVLRDAAAQGVVVFARSALLQGALLLAPERLPRHLVPLRATVAALHAVAERSGLAVPQLAVRAVLEQPGVASVVVGVERAAQLAPHAAAAARGPLPPGLLDAVAAAARALPPEVLDPSRWPRAAA